MTDSSRLSDAFEVCLAAMRTGVDLENCLKLYPDMAAELRPVLITAQDLRQHASINMPAAGMKRSRAKMLAQAEALNKARRPLFLRAAPRLALTALALVMVLVLTLNGLVVTSAKSLPGDALYPVKLAAENASLGLVRNPEARLKMEESYQQRRAEEIRTLLSEKRISRVSFEGVIEEVSPQVVVVQGIPVALDADTIVKGELLPGRLVKVEGTTQTDGQVNAQELHLRFYEFTGQLTDIQPGAWTIGGTRFKILRETHLDPTLRVGERVLVLVYASDDGSLYAQAILRVPATLVEEKQSFKPFEIEFTGTLQSISGNTLVVDGKSVQVSDQTELKGDFTIGTILTVHAIVAEDGSLTAREIQVTGIQGGPGEGQPGEDHSGNTGGSDDQVEESGDDQSSEDGSSEDDSGENKSGDEDKSDNEDESGNEDQSNDGDESNDQDQPDDEDQSGNNYEDDNSDEVSGEEDHSGEEDSSGSESGDITEDNSGSESDQAGEVSDAVSDGEDNPERVGVVD